MQVVAAARDAYLVEDALGSYFPSVSALRQPAVLDERFAGRYATALDFGLAREFMMPLNTETDPDALTALIGTLAGFTDGIGVVQVLWQPVEDAWASAISDAVYTKSGDPFFQDAPELSRHADKKVAQPLYAVALRLAVAGDDAELCWQRMRALASGLSVFGAPSTNDFVPLSGHDDEVTDVVERTTHRTGMLLNLEELAALVHLPVLAAPVQGYSDRRVSAAAPRSLTDGELTLGVNRHRGQTRTVSLSQGHRLRHLHVVGATGTGKSTFMLSLIAQDLREGRGVALIDPHGDLVDDALSLVPRERAADVVLIDPSCQSHVVGWNVLSGESETEREMLSSDLTAVFRRLATSWGDQMTAVLDNALAVFLEHERGDTLLDVRRFFLDKGFRTRMLAGVADEYVRGYWEHEFPLIASRHPEAPILTRLNGFLRGKAVRRTVTERQRPVDFRSLVDGGGILFAKLCQGTIGRENAALLGSLLVSKLHQTALFRQERAAEERRPFYLYIDEFHEVAVPSMAALFTGARKYRLGLCIAHQDLEQLRSSSSALAEAVLANAHCRVCFRVGERDARALCQGFAHFSAEDLGGLGIGEAIARVGAVVMMTSTCRLCRRRAAMRGIAKKSCASVSGRMVVCGTSRSRVPELPQTVAPAPDGISTRAGAGADTGSETGRAG